MTAIVCLPSADGVVVVADRLRFDRGAWFDWRKLGVLEHGIAGCSWFGGGAAVSGERIYHRIEAASMPTPAVDGSDVVEGLLRSAFTNQAVAQAYHRSDAPFIDGYGLTTLFVEWLPGADTPSICAFDHGATYRSGGPFGLKYRFRTYRVPMADSRRSGLFGIGSGMLLAQALDTDGGRRRFPDLASDPDFTARIIRYADELLPASHAIDFCMRYVSTASRLMGQLDAECVGSIGDRVDIVLVARSGTFSLGDNVALGCAKQSKFVATG